MKVLCIGSSSIEITCPIKDPIVEDSHMKLSEKIECGGGNAGNIAYLLGKWGVETYIASMLGADDAASKIKKEYENIGVKTDFVETSYDKPTSESIILLNKTNKNKTIFELANNVFLKKYAFNIEPDIIIADGNDYNASLAAFDKYQNSIGFLSISEVSNEILSMGKYVKYIILNKKSAEDITNNKIDFNNSSTIVNIYNNIKQRFINAEIIITLGERGCVYSINGQIKVMPPVKVDIVDTNGAGAIFVGAFAYATGRNFGLEKSIAYATIAASLSTTKLTSRLSIPSLTEVSGYYDSKFGAQNNPNNQHNSNNDSNVNMNTNSNIQNNMNINTNNMEVNNNVNSQNS